MRPGPWVVVTARVGGRDGTRSSFNQVRARRYQDGRVELQILRHEPGSAPRVLREVVLIDAAWQTIVDGLRT